MSKKQNAPLLKDEAMAAAKHMLVCSERMGLHGKLFSNSGSDIQAMCFIEACAECRKAMDKCIEVNERIQKAMTNWSFAK